MVRVFLVLISSVLVLSVFAQELETVGRIVDGWEYAELKDPRPTSEFMKYSDKWEHKEIFVGSELRTTRGDRSEFELMFIDGSYVCMLPRTQIVVGKEGENVSLSMKIGGLKITSGGKLLVITPEGNLRAEKGAEYRVILEKDGKEAEYTAVKGDLVVTNRLGVSFTLKEGAQAFLRYNPEEDSYSLVIAPESKARVTVKGKDETHEVGVNGLVRLLGAGGFSVEKVGETPKERRLHVIVEGLEAKFGFNLLFGGCDYEVDANYNYYRGGIDRFELGKAEFVVKGELKNYLTILLSADARKDEVLNNAYLQVAFSEKKYLPSFRFGQFRIPFGIELQKGTESLLFADYSLITKYGFCGLQAQPDSYDADLMYDIGVAVYGYLIGEEKPEGDAGYFAVDYRAGVFNGAGRNGTENDTKKTSSSRLGIRLAKWLSIGGSYYDGSTTTATEEYHRYRRGADITFDFDFFKLTGEYIYASDDPRVGKHGNNTEGFYIQGQLPLSFLGDAEMFKETSFIFRYEVMNPAFKSIPGISRDDWEKVTRWDVGFRYEASENIAFILFFEHLDQGDIRYPLGVKVGEADDIIKFFVAVKCW